MNFIFFFFQRYKATTLRRYNDFLAFHELLLMRFPYRSIPRLPPKKMMGGKFSSKNENISTENFQYIYIFRKIEHFGFGLRLIMKQYFWNNKPKLTSSVFLRVCIKLLKAGLAKKSCFKKHECIIENTDDIMLWSHVYIKDMFYLDFPIKYRQYVVRFKKYINFTPRAIFWYDLWYVCGCGYSSSVVLSFQLMSFTICLRFSFITLWCLSENFGLFDAVAVKLVP